MRGASPACRVCKDAAPGRGHGPAPLGVPLAAAFAGAQPVADRFMQWHGGGCGRATHAAEQKAGMRLLGYQSCGQTKASTSTLEAIQAGCRRPGAVARHAGPGRKRLRAPPAQREAPHHQPGQPQGAHQAQQKVRAVGGRQRRQHQHGSSCTHGRGGAVSTARGRQAAGRSLAALSDTSSNCWAAVRQTQSGQRLRDRGNRIGAATAGREAA